MRDFTNEERNVLQEWDLNFERDTSIDPDSLDVECIEIAQTTMDYCTVARQAAEERDNLRLHVDVTKDELDRVKAQVALEVRDDPDAFDLNKVTEEAIKSVVANDKRVLEAQEEHYQAWRDYNDAKYFQGLIQDAVTCMQVKKDTLEKLIRLHAMGYFSSPKVAQELTTNAYAKRAKRERAKDIVRKRMKSKRGRG